MKPAIHFKLTDDNKTYYISGAPAEPLTLDDLLSFEKHSSFTLKLKNAKLYSANELENKTINFSETITTTYTNQCFALVESGWLPPMFALSGALVLADRNMISHISSRFSQGKLVERPTHKPDFFDLTILHDYQATFNLSPFALEGNLKRRPSRSEVVDQLQEADRKILEALPNVNRTPINDVTVDGIMGLISDSQDTFRKRINFLMSSVHLLGSTAGKMRRRETWTEIIKLADKSQLQRTDICVVAAISSATASGTCNPARGILKPKENYAEEDAYNALCDIQLISLLIHALHDFPTEKIVLLTKDISLAKFWSGISPLNTSKQTPIVSCKLNIHKNLLPIDQYWLDELNTIIEGR